MKSSRDDQTRVETLFNSHPLLTEAKCFHKTEIWKFCFADDNKSLLLVTELVPQGSLDKYLKDQKNMVRIA